MTKMQEYEALCEAYTIIHQRTLELCFGPDATDAIWQILSHAEKYINQQIKELLRR